MCVFNEINGVSTARVSTFTTELDNWLNEKKCQKVLYNSMIKCIRVIITKWDLFLEIRGIEKKKFVQ